MKPLDFPLQSDDDIAADVLLTSGSDRVFSNEAEFRLRSGSVGIRRVDDQLERATVALSTR